MKKTIFLYLLFAFGCKAINNTEYNSNIKKLSTRNLVNKIQSKDINYDFLSIRAKSKIIETNSTNQINLAIRIEKDKNIIINGTILIPLFKAKLTKESVVFYEKINKTYYEGNYQNLSGILNYEFTFRAFQRVLTGQPIIGLDELKWEQLPSSKEYSLINFTRKKNVKAEYLFNPVNLTLKSQKIISNNNTLIAEYENYQFVEGSFFPKKIMLLATSEEKQIKILLDLNISKTGNSSMFSFEKPKGYKEIQL
jgi:hypothetical protein